MHKTRILLSLTLTSSALNEVAKVAVLRFSQLSQRRTARLTRICDLFRITNGVTFNERNIQEISFRNVLVRNLIKRDI